MSDQPGAPIDLDFERLANCSVDLQCVAGTDGYFYWLGPQWPPALGWSHAELMAKPFLEWVHPDDVAGTLEVMEELAAGKPTISFRNRYRHKDGSWRWLDWVCRPHEDGNLYAAARDVTVYVNELNRSRENEQLWEMAAELGTMGYWHVDLVRNEVTWSDEVYRIHGRDRATFTPTLESGFGAYHLDDRVRVQRAVEEAIHTRSSFEYQLRLIRTDGEERIVHSIGSPRAEGKGGDITSIIGVFRDVTEDTILRTINEELGQYTHVASHDMKEPMRSIVGYLSIVREDASKSLTSESQQCLDRAINSAERMTTLIDDLLTYSNSGVPGRFTAVSINELVDDAIQDHRRLIEETDAAVTRDPLPNVRGNEERMRHVFHNLIANALKYRSDAAPEIHISAEEEGDNAVVTVTDNGVGIPAESHKSVLQPFKRLHRRSEVSGSGLGLAIVARAVEQCGGNIRIETAASGKGTAIVLSLPMEPKVETPSLKH